MQPRQPPPDLLARIEERVAADLKPVRPRSARRGALWLTAVAGALAVTALLVASWRSGLRPAALDALLLPAALLLVLAAYHVAIRVATPAATPPRVVLLLLAVAPFALLVASAALRGPLYLNLADCLEGAGSCLGVTLGLTVVPAAVAIHWLRDSFRISSAVAGVSAGAASGILGAVATHIICQATECTHVLLFHGGAVAVSAIAGGAIWALFGRRPVPSSAS